MSKENKTLDKHENGNDFIADVSHSGYICQIGKWRVFIIAESIAQAMDKMKEISGGVFGYSIESHSSIRVIHCS